MYVNVHSHIWTYVSAANMQLNAETHAKKGLKTCLYGLSNFNFLNSEKKDENFIFVNLIEEILA